jgi:hypothetical protein
MGCSFNALLWIKSLELHRVLDHAQFRDEVSRVTASVREMWIPPALLEDKNFYEKVRADFERIGISAVPASAGIDRIVDEVIDVASRIQRPSSYANFHRLFERYLESEHSLEGRDAARSMAGRCSSFVS